MAHITRISLLAFCLVAVAPGAAGAKPPPNQPPKKHAAAAARAASSVPSRIRPTSRPVATRKLELTKVSLGQRAVQIAADELGVPYRYGGMSPSGFDCSGLVAYVYGKLGVELPHNAAAQYGYGRPVSRSQLEPGDLVFFSGLGHVGLYIGGGKIIHAPRTGRTVEIQSLSERSGSLQGARRLVRS